jgi:tetratricopeptide (TPR) repeat protein
MDNANLMLTFIRVASIIIITWSILFSVYSGSATVIPSAIAQMSEEENVSSLYSKAFEAIEQGRYEEAIEYLDRALTIEPNHVLALTSMGGALVGLGKYQEAIEYLDRALTIEPNNINALYNKGLALHNLERYEEAIGYYDRALAINPD